MICQRLSFQRFPPEQCQCKIVVPIITLLKIIPFRRLLCHKIFLWWLDRGLPCNGLDTSRNGLVLYPAIPWVVRAFHSSTALPIWTYILKLSLEFWLYQHTWTASQYSFILSTATIFVSTSDVMRMNQFKVCVICEKKRIRYQTLVLLKNKIRCIHWGRSWLTGRQDLRPLILCQ